MKRRIKYRVALIFLVVVWFAMIVAMTVRYHFRVMTTEDRIGCVVVAISRTIEVGPIADYNAVEETRRIYPWIKSDGLQILDSWNNPLIIEITVIDKAIRASITSKGPDSRLGTDDDLVRTVLLPL